VNRRAEIQTWLRELGATIVDFWANWVIEPTRNVIGTIRHSEESEVALMSRKSLAADMESLERMVVDFVADNPSSATENGTSEVDPVLVRARVKEGDLTPVLKVYERDLRSPFKGTVRGDLVRALLIQVQKTKVDVEVAISGIDRLLKSQELVFGFVGLTPGIIVCLGVSRWFMTTFRGRDQKGGQKRKERMVWTLRNIDRILTASNGLRGENGGSLTYKEHGLLLCEVHVLREDAKKALPKNAWAKFAADLEELIDVRRGVLRQSRVLDRMRWYDPACFLDTVEANVLR
jgi:nuclear-control-of-ATPase protein 2